MFDFSIFFITITLAILIFSAFKLKIPKAGGPLIFIYILFLIYYWTNSDSKELTKDSRKEPEIQLKSSDNSKYSKNSNPIISNLRPKPLVLPKTVPKNKPKLNRKNQKNSPSIQIKKRTKQPAGPYLTSMTLRDIQICREIKNRSPFGTDNYFTNSVDTLFCYTRIQNTGGKQELSHQWYFENELISTVRYNIKTSNIYRSWTRKTIFSHQIGNWRVDVLDTAGVLIGSKNFYITKSNNTNN